MVCVGGHPRKSSHGSPAWRDFPRPSYVVLKEGWDSVLIFSVDIRVRKF